MALLQRDVSTPAKAGRWPRLPLVIFACLSLLASSCVADPDTESNAATPDASSQSPSTSSNDNESSELDDDAAGQTEADPDDPSADVFQQPSAEALEILAELDGKLAIGNGPLLAVSRPDGRAYIELDGDRLRHAGQPTWSGDGSQLIWSSASAVSQEVSVQRFDDEGLVDGDPNITVVPGPPVFYFQWSSDDSEVLYLRNSPRRPTVEAGIVDPGVSASWMADGNPFFVSWAADQKLIAGHVGDDQILLFDPSGSQNLEQRLLDDVDPVDPAGPVAGQVIAPGGGFSAPAWVDDKTLLVVTEGSLSLASTEDSGVIPLLDLDGPVRFVVSPDRSKVALQLVTELGSDQVVEAGLGHRSVGDILPVQQGSPLVVFDLESRVPTVVTETPAIAWEWSPDGSKLAWLELDGPVARRQGRWRFWSPDGSPVDDTSSPLVGLTDKELVNYLPFFAQYAQSTTRWSPDSTAFALAGAIDDRIGIWIHLVGQTGAPVLVAPGDFVTWGPGPSPPPTAGRSPA